MFTYRNIAIATVVVLVLIVGYYVLKPSKKVEVTPTKSAVTQSVTPAKPVVTQPVAPAKK
jgi:hypothetical protein